MGTNYYLKKEKNRKVNEPDLHIGNSSIGWEFNWQGHEAEEYYNTPKLMSKEEWMEYIFLNEQLLYNEYDEKVSFKDFAELIESKKPGTIQNQKQLKNHYDYYMKKDGYCSHAFKDKDGFTISTTDFS